LFIDINILPKDENKLPNFEEIMDLTILGSQGFGCPEVFNSEDI